MYNRPMNSSENSQGDQHEQSVPDPAVTQLLAEAASGNESAVEELLPLVYAQLRAVAQMRMASERTGHTLQATALVHEAI
jgi:hypothetical protein